ARGALARGPGAPPPQSRPPAGATPPAPSGSRPGRPAKRGGGGTPARPARATPLPAHLSELLIRPLGDRGEYVIKNPRTRAFFHLGEAEHFLLTQLDGERTAEAIRAAYAERFGEPLSEDELDGFV